MVGALRFGFYNVLNRCSPVRFYSIYNSRTWNTRSIVDTYYLLTLLVGFDGTSSEHLYRIRRLPLMSEQNQ